MAMCGRTKRRPRLHRVIGDTTTRRTIQCRRANTDHAHHHRLLRRQQRQREAACFPDSRWLTAIISGIGNTPASVGNSALVCCPSTFPRTAPRRRRSPRTLTPLIPRPGGIALSDRPVLPGRPDGDRPILSPPPITPTTTNITGTVSGSQTLDVMLYTLDGADVYWDLTEHVACRWAPVRPSASCRAITNMTKSITAGGVSAHNSGTDRRNGNGLWRLRERDGDVSRDGQRPTFMSARNSCR